MYSAKSYELTKSEFNYLLPAIKKKLMERNGKYYFIGDNFEELEDMLSRLKGFYDNYDDELNKTIIYKCAKEGSIEPFRKFVNTKTENKMSKKQLLENKLRKMVREVLNESPEKTIIKSFEMWVTDYSKQSGDHPRAIKSIIQSYLSKL